MELFEQAALPEEGTDVAQKIQAALLKLDQHEI